MVNKVNQKQSEEDEVDKYNYLGDRQKYKQTNNNERRITQFPQTDTSESDTAKWLRLRARGPDTGRPHHFTALNNINIVGPVERRHTNVTRTSASVRTAD